MRERNSGERSDNMYIVIQGETFLCNTAPQIRAAQIALKDAGLSEELVWHGEPESPDSYQDDHLKVFAIDVSRLSSERAREIIEEEFGEKFGANTPIVVNGQLTDGSWSEAARLTSEVTFRRQCREWIAACA